MKIVLANGVFDIIHYGHIEHLRQARAMGDLLIVSVTADGWVNKGPGRPINNWEYRSGVLLELRCIDQVIRTIGAVAAINRVRPNIFVKGIDYAGGDMFTEEIEKACKAVGAELRYTDTKKVSIKELILKAMA